MIKELVFLTSIATSTACFVDIKPKKRADRSFTPPNSEVVKAEKDQAPERTNPGVDPELKKNPLDVKGLANASLNDYPLADHCDAIEEFTTRFYEEHFPESDPSQIMCSNIAGKETEYKVIVQFASLHAIELVYKNPMGVNGNQEISLSVFGEEDSSLQGFISSLIRFATLPKIS